MLWAGLFFASVTFDSDQIPSCWRRYANVRRPERAPTRRPRFRNGSLRGIETSSAAQRQPLSVFLNATGFRMRRAALRGGGYDGRNVRMGQPSRASHSRSIEGGSPQFLPLAEAQLSGDGCSSVGPVRTDQVLPFGRTISTR
jgi:hypothetical protein